MKAPENKSLELAVASEPYDKGKRNERPHFGLNTRTGKTGGERRDLTNGQLTQTPTKCRLEIPDRPKQSFYSG